MQVSFRLNDEEAKTFERLRGGLSKPVFAKLRALAEPSAEVDGLPQAQALVDAKNEEIARLKRELAARPAEAPRLNLPGLSGKHFVCGECGNLNSRGRCVDHPRAQQKPLKSAA